MPIKFISTHKSTKIVVNYEPIIEDATTDIIRKNNL